MTSAQVVQICYFVGGEIFVFMSAIFGSGLRQSHSICSGPTQMVASVLARSMATRRILTAAWTVGGSYLFAAGDHNIPVIVPGLLLGWPLGLLWSHLASRQLKVELNPPRGLQDVQERVERREPLMASILPSAEASVTPLPLRVDVAVVIVAQLIGAACAYELTSYGGVHAVFRAVFR